MAFNIICLERSMDPEAIEAGSWMTTTLSDPPTSCSAFRSMRASKASHLGASPAAIVYFDVSSLFGDSEVTSQLDRLNSGDTYRVE